MTGQREAPVLAVDIGGTKIMTAIVPADGRVLAKDVSPTLAGEGVPSVVDRLCRAAEKLVKSNNLKFTQLAGIGIACAGAINTGRGMVTVSPNLPGWVDIPLAQMVRERLKVDTFLVNDASAAALGEHRYGAGKGVKHLVLLTLGTGIGGGIIADGRLYLGASGAAGEIGHMTIDVNGPECPGGHTGCLEVLASGTAIVREAVRRLKNGEESSLTEMVGGKAGGITAETVEKAARNGDGLAREVLARAAYYLGVGLANVVNIFNPEMVILGGGMAGMDDLLIDPARRLVAERAFPVSAGAVKIATARLGNEAGVYGAAAFVREAGKGRKP
ncbi:MAG: hypothetical protein A2Z05_03895 [Chloroflexi bacterium RBG_16_60_22]|nr:MAG: hypothetical protein A2Z05_03895 [Chloroflexi bacterium RBG_16_60_22]